MLFFSAILAGSFEPLGPVSLRSSSNNVCPPTLVVDFRIRHALDSLFNLELGGLQVSGDLLEPKPLASAFFHGYDELIMIEDV
jgi:hypothetical protein